ncbi:hypothetical protein Taro_037851 [Colocasia esculenta]|uniref:Uncharacterized protein n=1 Tax=Colocasia esculenta TaxID=4460 RepID=A0A843WB08_COLES|nr:hypothetical protein [Colocasia esculenta]
MYLVISCGALAPVALWEYLFSRLVRSGEFMLTSSYIDEAPVVIGGNQMPVYCFCTCVLVCSVLGEFPTELVTGEAHTYPPQVRARRTFRYRRPVRSHVTAVLGQRLQ